MPALSYFVKAAVALVLLMGPAGSQDWQQFGFRKLGFGFDVPRSFVLKQTAEDAAGATFEAGDGASLAVWGHNLSKRFKETVRAQLNADEEEGWDVTYQRITPSWASYSGIKNGRIRYFRAIAVCGDRVGVFQLDYEVEDKVLYDPIVVRMVRSLKVDGC